MNFYKPWSNMKMLMLFHDFDVIGLLFHYFDIIGSVIPWFWRHRSVNHVIYVTNHIYHGSYSWTYLNQLILRIRWFKVVDLGYPKNFPIIQFFLNLHHGIVMSKYIICQNFKKFHRAVFSIAHPKYSNFGVILDARW